MRWLGWSLAGSVLFLNGGSHLYAQKLAEGATLTALTRDGKTSAIAWAKHGNLIACVREHTTTQRQLLILDADGSGERLVSSIGNPIYAEWSWAGRRLAYEYTNAEERDSQGGVFVFDADTGKTVSVSNPYTLSGLDEDEGPLWSAGDRMVVYKVRVGPSRTRQLWIGDAVTGAIWQLLPDMGQSRSASWGPLVPPRLTLRVESGGGSYDVAAVDPDGRDFERLTDVGTQSIRTRTPHWSPAGGWIAFGSDAEMTQEERGLHRSDCWIARPDGSEARNLTHATSPATEKQLSVGDLIWSWDGRWILSEGSRYDVQGNRISTLYLIDPRAGGYEIILTSHPRETSELQYYYSVHWSPDSTLLAVLLKRMTVRNWGGKLQYENRRWVLGLYNVQERKLHEILSLDENLDSKKVLGSSDRGELEDISWSPDGRSLLVTIAKILSADENIRQPDVYRLDLPPELISPTAAEHDGPPIGRPGSLRAAPAPPDQSGQEGAAPAPPSTQPAPPAQAAGAQGTEQIIELVQPEHITVKEALAVLSSDFGSYIRENEERNYLFFKGPPEVLAELRRELALIDTPLPHILVDLLAVELSDEANRNLGLDWTYAEGHFAFFQPGGNAIRDLTPDERLGGLITYPGSGQSFFQGVNRLPREFFIRLSSLIQTGEGTILANPRTVSMSGKEASINIRTTLNYFFNEGFDTSGRPVVKKSDITSETLGRITPTLLADGRIHLVVEVGVGSFTFTAQAGLPEQTSRKSTTEVTVRQGETVVIGGMRRQEEVHTVTKTPILGDIPLLGWLFTSEQTSIRHSVLTIFITPWVLQPGDPEPDWPRLEAENHTVPPIMVKRPHEEGH